jgi:hypothetical protein
VSVVCGGARRREFVCGARADEAAAALPVRLTNRRLCRLSGREHEIVTAGAARKQRDGEHRKEDASHRLQHCVRVIGRFTKLLIMKGEVLIFKISM